LHTTQFPSLSLSEIVFVGRSSVEGQRVVRVLRVLLVEDIVPTVVPVGEGSVIRACLLGGLGRSSNFLLFHLGLFTPLSLKLSFVCCSQVHLVRVDDLALLLKVEGLLVAFDFSLGKFLCVVLSVVGEEGLRVGVADESISAASLSRSLVTGW
jgi:hypothetical protein